MRLFCIATAIFLCGCNEAIGPNEYAYFVVEMPVFIGDRTGDSCDPSIAGYWKSMDNEIGITYKHSAISRKTLNPSEVMNKQIESKWFYMDSEPKLKKSVQIAIYPFGKLLSFGK